MMLTHSSIDKKISNTYILLFSCVLLLDYLSAALNVVIIDKILPLLLIFIGILTTLKAESIAKPVFIIFIFLAIHFAIVISFLFVHPIASFYELFKIYTFLYFIPIFCMQNERKLYLKVNSFFMAFLLIYGINLVVIILQYLIDPSIILNLGMPDRLINSSNKVGRWIGFFDNLPAFAISALLVYIFCDWFGDSFKYKKAVKALAAVSVLISTSKLTIAMFSLYYIYSMAKINRISASGIIKIIILVTLLITLSSYVLYDRLSDKIEQYTYFYQVIMHGGTVNTNLIEYRLQNIFEGIKIFSQNIFGLGLGTWGDFSSTLNNNPIPYTENHMSDSAFIHLLVEQGVFLVFYYLVMLSPCFFVNKQKRQRVIILFNVYFIATLASMGMSDSVWPLVFALLYAATLLSQSEGNIVE